MLGIAKLRFKATDEQIKKAYRFKVLKHHPDKRRAAGEDIREDDDYFTCITKAFETLGNPAKRRAFDSVDPLFDDDVPEMKKGQDFIATFAPAFERNARWSVKKHVPKLGDEEATREKVDRFYKFWYDFDSWREFSYLDEEDKEKGSDREERRWIEKNNRIQRAERKKEEMRRIRKLVDNAYNADVRIARFKEEDRQEKAAKKKAKQDAAKARRDEEERVRREEEERERAKKAAEEAEAKAKQEAAKKEKEAQKKALKQQRKTVRNVCKENGFFAADEDEKVKHLSEVDRICEILDVEELERLGKALAVEGRPALLRCIAEVDSRQEKERMETMEKSSKGSGGGADKSGGSGAAWSSDELSLLIKAVNLFPAGENLQHKKHFCCHFLTMY